MSEHLPIVGSRKICHLVPLVSVGTVRITGESHSRAAGRGVSGMTTILSSRVIRDGLAQPFCGGNWAQRRTVEVHILEKIVGVTSTYALSFNLSMRTGLFSQQHCIECKGGCSRGEMCGWWGWCVTCVWCVCV
jgi:hypothetical protein